jgi:hypothetical protein
MSRLKPFASPILIASIAVTTAFAGRAAQEEEPPPRYVGVSHCAQCHSSEGLGQQVQSWREGPHGKAWERLGSEEAAELAKRLGVDDPQTAPECLRCHSTGAGLSRGRFTKDFDALDGVQCESCHGPGERYAKVEHMILSDTAKSLGLIDPSPRVCRQCHNDKSPTFKGFDYREAVKKITHALAPY